MVVTRAKRAVWNKGLNRIMSSAFSSFEYREAEGILLLTIQVVDGAMSVWKQKE